MVTCGSARLASALDVPVSVDQWVWACGFYSMGAREDGTSPNFLKARADFEAAWLRLLPKITEADLVEY
jgi:hypothetical protein